MTSASGIGGGEGGMTESWFGCCQTQQGLIKENHVLGPSGDERKTACFFMPPGINKHAWGEGGWVGG